jgi:DNA-binding response OmpR family regulator
MSLVLVAEDSASIRLLLKRRLEMAGHVVLEARDAADALGKLGSGREGDGPDIVLLDAMMPGADGAEVLRKIKAEQPLMPVLVVTALHDLDEADGWGLADGHVTKPIDFGELLARIDAVTGVRPRP